MVSYLDYRDFLQTSLLSFSLAHALPVHSPHYSQSSFSKIQAAQKLWMAATALRIMLTLLPMVSKALRPLRAPTSPLSPHVHCAELLHHPLLGTRLTNTLSARMLFPGSLP